MLMDIYREYGMDVFIDVSISTDENTYVKKYNGVTIEAGYSDPSMINNLDRNTCCIRSTKENPIRIYRFIDPIDSAEQNALFQKIIEENIMERRFRHNLPEYPTVIMAPKINRDTESYLRRVTEMLLSFGEAKYSQKPRLLIVTNYLGVSENYVEHIATLCGCKPIKKYIDDNIQKIDQESGLAPTLDNVTEFYGSAAEVEADTDKTKFVDPALMYAKDENDNIIMEEDGTPKLSSTYSNIINFIYYFLSINIIR